MDKGTDANILGEHLAGLPRAREDVNRGLRSTCAREEGWLKFHRRLVGVVVVCLAVLLQLGLSREVLAQSTTRAFAIPSSNLMFNGTLVLSSGARVQFSAREGSMILIDPKASDWKGQIGIILRLDRTIASEDDLGTVNILASKIVPNSAGGDTTTFQRPVSGKYGDVVHLDVDGYKLELSVTEDWLGDFRDGSVVTMLWGALRKNSKALEGIYDEVYSVYGPTAQDCILCYGALVCSTDIVGCDGGGGGGGWTF